MELSRELKGLGVDIVSVAQIGRWIEQFDRQTLTLIFTAFEIRNCDLDNDPAEAYAICFAAKEAVGKALGTGLVEIDWPEIEIERSDRDLVIHLYGNAYLRALEQGITDWQATWLPWNDHLLVQVLAQ